jgi:hypothetical protein
LKIVFNENEQLFLNDLELKSKTKIEKVSAILGEATSKSESPNGDITYKFENLGMIIMTTKNGSLKGIGINYNWDGDDKFPKTMFTGNLTLGKTAIDANSKSATISTSESNEFACLFPVLCFSKNKEANTVCTIGFKDDLLTQIVFLFK